MLRRVLLCSAVALGTVIVSAPSASGQPLCVDTDANRPVSYDPAAVCVYQYPFGAPCFEANIENNIVFVENDLCLPGPMAEVLP